jgi:hypothetical protein
MAHIGATISRSAQARRRVRRIPPRVRDVASRPCRWDETAGDMQLIWVKMETKTFDNVGLTQDRASSPSGNQSGYPPQREPD